MHYSSYCFDYLLSQVHYVLVVACFLKNVIWILLEYVNVIPFSISLPCGFSPTAVRTLSFLALLDFYPHPWCQYQGLLEPAKVPPQLVAHVPFRYAHKKYPGFCHHLTNTNLWDHSIWPFSTHCQWICSFSFPHLEGTSSFSSLRAFRPVWP